MSAYERYEDGSLVLCQGGDPYCDCGVGIPGFPTEAEAEADEATDY